MGNVEDFVPETTTATAFSEITQEIEDKIAATFEETSDNCTRDGYMMVSYSAIYIFFLVLASIFVLIALVIVLIGVVHKRKRFRPRHGEYKLTEKLRKVSLKQGKLESTKTADGEDMY